MKLLNLDIGLQTRQELTRELHYTGDMIGAASMDLAAQTGQVELSKRGGRFLMS